MLISFTSVVVILAGSAAAQTPVSPEKQRLIQELLDVSGSTKSINETIDMVMALQVGETKKMLSELIQNDKNFTAAEKQEMKQSMEEMAERTSKRFREFFKERLNLGQIVTEVVLPIYDKNFAESDLQDIINFYRTPTGQKVVSTMPAITAEMMSGFMSRVSPKLQDFMKESIESEMTLMKEKLKSTQVRKPVRRS